MVLEAIVARKRSEVSRQKRLARPDELRRGLGPSERSLESALRRPRTGFILECKKASPSRGTIRHDFDVARLARTLSRYADAISVLTDEPAFGGRLEFLRAASDASSLPILCKDFIVDPFQVYQARGQGADAVLLMLSVLDDDAFHRCFLAASSLGMDVLAEIHDERELDRALELGARVIGINNRDLHTLEVDLDVTERLAPLVPGDRVVVSESGVSSHADVRRLGSKVDGFLVGTALMARRDVSRAARELIYGSVKVCGLSCSEDARAASVAGATHGGLVFVESSKRAVGLETAREVREVRDLRWVGVFVNERVGRIVSLTRELGLDVVQLHGDEGADVIAELRRRLPADTRIWKAWRVGRSTPEIPRFDVDRILLDSFHASQRGGTGVPFDWSILSELDLSEMVIAGGLDPSNAAKADGLGAHALDVSSGVEESPGRKCPSRLTAFFAELRGHEDVGERRMS